MVEFEVAFVFVYCWQVFVRSVDVVVSWSDVKDVECGEDEWIVCQFWVWVVVCKCWVVFVVFYYCCEVWEVYVVKCWFVDCDFLLVFVCQFLVVSCCECMCDYYVVIVI